MVIIKNLFEFEISADIEKHLWSLKACFWTGLNNLAANIPFILAGVELCVLTLCYILDKSTRMVTWKVDHYTHFQHL